MSNRVSVVALSLVPAALGLGTVAFAAPPWAS